jgi:hypothetical protein
MFTATFFGNISKRDDPSVSVRIAFWTFDRDEPSSITTHGKRQDKN